MLPQVLPDPSGAPRSVRPHLPAFSHAVVSVPASCTLHFWLAVRVLFSSGLAFFRKESLFSSRYTLVCLLSMLCFPGPVGIWLCTFQQSVCSATFLACRLRNRGAKKNPSSIKEGRLLPVPSEWLYPHHRLARNLLCSRAFYPAETLQHLVALP